jgi:hypothetical protein
VPDANGHFDLIRDLMGLDMGQLYSKIITKDPDRSSFGFLPLMAGCSDGKIGALNSESFTERVISAANLVMTEGSTLLCDEDLDMLVVLRMNRNFMAFMRENYFEEIKGLQRFNVSVIE